MKRILRKIFIHTITYYISQETAQAISKGLTTLEPGDTLKIESPTEKIIFVIKK